VKRIPFEWLSPHEAATAYELSTLDAFDYKIRNNDELTSIE
jgi:hypothetical protein